MKKKTTQEQIDKINALAKEGFSDWEIAEVVGVSEQTASKFTRRYWQLKMQKINSTIDERLGYTLFDELLEAFKSNCSSFTINKKEITALIDKCETYKRNR